MSWTDERIDLLKSMWEKGMTASQIADELGGVSRNAVIGKAHRLGLKARPSPVKPGEEESAAPPPPRAPAQPRAQAAPKAASAAPTEVKPVNAPVPLPSTARPAGSQGPVVRSIGPGGFVRQNPGEQTAPSTPAPPRRLVPAKPSPEIADKTSLLDLNDRICRWPMGHPGEPDFHFCGEPVNPGFPYCVPHCGLAFQAQLPRRERKPLPAITLGIPKPTS